MHTPIRRAFALGCLLVTIVTSFAAHADDAVLIVVGKVPGGEVTLTRDEIAGLPQRALTEQPTSFPEPLAFKGPSLSEVLKLAGATGGDITVSAADDYKVDITADELKAFDPILAIEKDGVRMAPDDFGPFFVMWPFKERLAKLVKPSVFQPVSNKAETATRTYTHTLLSRKWLIPGAPVGGAAS